MAVTKQEHKSKKVDENKKVEDEVMAVESSETEESGLESELDVDESEESESEIEGMEANESGKHQIKKLENKKQKDSSNKNKDAKDAISGIIYVGRLPRGFHEKELSKYFSQFGDLKEVRLARNKKTGNSRHYGFVQFVNPDDSRVAHDTMNNYLLMGHLLQVRLLPKGSKIEKLYKYKQRAFSAPPKPKKSAKELKELSSQKHEERMEKLKKAGINFEY